MKKFLLLIVAVLMLGCNGPVRNYRTHNNNDINEVIKAIILQDTLNKKGLPFSVDLGRPGVADKHWNFGMNMDRLFDEDKPCHFEGLDRSYIDFQHSTLTGFKIDKKLMPNMAFTSFNELVSKPTEVKKRSYFLEMSIPLFSVDQQQACVLLTSYYGYMASVGYEYTVRMVNGKWKIICKRQTWTT